MFNSARIQKETHAEVCVYNITHFFLYQCAQAVSDIPLAFNEELLTQYIQQSEQDNNTNRHHKITTEHIDCEDLVTRLAEQWRTRVFNKKNSNINSTNTMPTKKDIHINSSVYHEPVVLSEWYSTSVKSKRTTKQVD